MSMVLEPPAIRLGDLLVRTQAIRPHQLGVALSVQRQVRLPLGRILVETRILSRFQLMQMLVRQWLLRRFRAAPQKVSLYSADLMAWGRQLLERHMADYLGNRANLPDEVRETLLLRAERAHFDRRRTARIVEKDRTLKERLFSGNF